MNRQIYIYDPTAGDDLSRVRGIGSYMYTLRENFNQSIRFIQKIDGIDKSSVLINPFFNLLSSPLLIKRHAKTQIAVIHDLIPYKYSAQFPIGLKGKIKTSLNKLALRLYDLILTDSEASKSDIVKLLKIDRKKVKVFYPTIKRCYFESELQAGTTSPILSDIPYFVYVGDATWNKNLINIAKAVKSADVTCAFIGSVFSKKHSEEDLNNPWMSELSGFMKVIKDDKRFIFPGFVNDEELMKIYKGAIGNILVSRDEGFGLSYLEAAAMGIPSIVGETSVQKEIASDAALFANPDSAEEIATAINKIKTNSELRDTLGVKAKERCRLFSPDVFKKNLMDILVAIA